MRFNNHKRKKETKFIILGIILIACFIIGILSLTIKGDRSFTVVEKYVKDAGIGIQNVLYTPFRFVGGKIDDYKEMKAVYKKYKNISDIESKAVLLEEENRELKSSLDDLKSLLDLNKLTTEYKVINATVINRNVGNWYNTLIIDKGEKSGLKADMIVITNEGLIGKITKTTFYSSEVKLITTPDLNNKISVGVITDDNTTYGLLSGYDKMTKELSVIDIIDNTSIKVGDKVITSGLGNIFPKGIIIGTVSKVEMDDFGISSLVKVKPIADFNNLRYVTVLGGIE
ncbi:MAG: rod shape-determining protein MreC [Bacilli bacterium]|nr:rod shape-determining protein MreC [Bacilli bacterium]MDD4411802.1 rod shape-determining protein MreC [Bacilli bacterium]